MAWGQLHVNAEMNYMRMDNFECNTTLEFKLYKQNENIFSFLSQAGRGTQYVECYKLNQKENSWEAQPYLVPELPAYFDGLSEDESKLVEKYGTQFVYISESSDTISWLFSEWQRFM